MVVASEVGFLFDGETDGIQSGLGFAKTIFWGKGFGKTSAEFSRPQKGVWGMNAGGFRTGGFRKFGGYKKILHIDLFEILV